MKLNDKIFIAIIILLSIIMFIFGSKKEGFHEDEMFSYGSSNYKYDNIFQQFGRSDSVNVFLKEKVFTGNIIESLKNWKYYHIDHVDQKDAFIYKTQQEDYPIWRTSQEAKEYLTIGKEDILNYSMVYYNQYRDIHPPMFYFLVHTISIFFYGSFSKYIIFIINLAFFIGSLFVLKNIMKVLNKEHLSNLVVIFYGLSMGAISTVMFQRMYMMLTFFILQFLYLNLKIVKNNYDIDKKTWIQLGLTSVLGFLTQYNFCIIAAIIALIVLVNIIRKKEKGKTKKYIINYLKIALIGVLLFPVSVSKILFSYRGVSSFKDNMNYFENLKQYIDLIGYSFSVPITILTIALAIFTGIIIYKMTKQNKRKITEILLLTIPTIVYVLLIPKTSPHMEYKYAIRYIMCILPFIAMWIVLMLDKVCKNKKQSIILISIITIAISVYGLATSKPKYMFIGYNKYLEIAEEYKDNNFVFIGNTTFNQIQNAQEFMTYKQSFIINENQLDFLTNNKELEEANEYILSIKKYLGNDYLLEQALQKSGYSNYELLLDDEGDVGCAIYKITK